MAARGTGAAGTTGSCVSASSRLAHRAVQLVPGMSSIAVVANLSNPGRRPRITGIQETIRALGVQDPVANATTAEDFEVAFAHLRRGRRAPPCGHRTMTSPWWMMPKRLSPAQRLLHHLRPGLTLGARCLTGGDAPAGELDQPQPVELLLAGVPAGRRAVRHEDQGFSQRRRRPWFPTFSLRFEDSTRA
jgi:hypothetical protein